MKNLGTFVSRGNRFGNLYTITQLVERIYFSWVISTSKHGMINLIFHLLLIYSIVIFSAVFTSYDDGSQPMDTFLLCLLYYLTVQQMEKEQRAYKLETYNI